MKKFNITLDNIKFTVSLSNRNTKRINIRIKDSNIIRVSKPSFVKEKALVEYLRESKDYIVKASKKVNDLANRRSSYIEDDFVYIFDKKYKIENLNLSDSLDIYLNEKLSSYVFLKKKSYDKIIKDYKLLPPKVSVKKMRGKWGKYYKNENKIYLNEKLVHYPKYCIDYVILHEYMHMIYFDHSREFYKLIEKWMPNYKKAVKYLKEN